jgi:tetratricopeptide (TPR) repeat protein
MPQNKIMTPRQTLVHSMLGGEVAGSALLSELIAEAIGSRVWGVYRLVVSWLATTGDKTAFFDRESIETLILDTVATEELDPSPEARTPSAGLVVLLTEMLDPDPDEHEAALGALAVAEWALGKNFVKTALAYSSLAAGLANTARYAWLTARHHRTYGSPRDAETWFRVASATATRERDWEAKARALIGLGVLRLTLGSYPEARNQFLRALRVAQRFALRERAGEIHHHLFTVGVATSDHALAEAEIEKVLASYGWRHPRLPHFVHDLAVYWTDRGDPLNALDVLLSLVEKDFFHDEPHQHLLALGSTARAAGCAGEPLIFERMCFEIHTRRQRADTRPEWVQVAQTLLLVARGAATLRRWVQAKKFLTEAMASGRRTNQHDVVLHAEELLAQVGQELHPEQPRTQPNVANRPVAERAIRLLQRAPVRAA